MGSPISVPHVNSRFVYHCCHRPSDSERLTKVRLRYQADPNLGFGFGGFAELQTRSGSCAFPCVRACAFATFVADNMALFLSPLLSDPKCTMTTQPPPVRQVHPRECLAQTFFSYLIFLTYITFSYLFAYRDSRRRGHATLAMRPLHCTLLCFSSFPPPLWDAVLAQ